MSTPKTPKAPPAYRPQPVPKVLQRKTAAAAQPPPSAVSSHKPSAPPAYRPQPVPHVLQAKMGPAGAVIQMKCDFCHEAGCHDGSQCGVAPNTNKQRAGKTGKYKNTSGHHDATKAKWRARKVKKNYTGQRGVH